MHIIDMTSFIQDIILSAARWEKNKDYLGRLTDQAQLSISNGGTQVNRQTPAILCDEITDTIRRINKLKKLLVMMEENGYNITKDQRYAEYAGYVNHFKKTLTNAQSVLLQLKSYLETIPKSES